MSREISFLLLLLFSPVLLLALHAALSRLVLALKIRLSSPLVALLSIAAGFGATLALGWALYLRFVETSGGLACGVLYVLLVYGCLAYAYLHVYLMGETARRLHILYELKVHGSMTAAEIAARYGAGDMLSARLDRLLAMQQLEEKGGRYVLRKQFLCFASRMIVLWADVLGFRSEIVR